MERRMTEDAIRTVNGRSETGCTLLISIADGTITIADGELTDPTANQLRLDTENAGKLGKVLVALAAALDVGSIEASDAKQSATKPTDDDRTLLRAMAARAARTPGSSGWSSEQLAMIDSLVARGADREEIKALTPERFVQFCEAWLQMDQRINETQCITCGKTFTYERMGRPPLTCSAECRRKRNAKAAARSAE
jgi:hypothetical protein